MKRVFQEIVLTVFALFFVGCASTAVTVMDVPEFPPPEADKGLVYFYRVKSFKGAAISYDVNQGQQVIGSIKNGTYFYHMVEPGLYQFWAKTEARKEVMLNVLASKTFYVKCGIGFGIMVGRPTFTIVPEVTGKNEIMKCKYAVIQ